VACISDAPGASDATNKAAKFEVLNGELLLCMACSSELHNV
jgi:hypothetical protein